MRILIIVICIFLFLFAAPAYSLNNMTFRTLVYYNVGGHIQDSVGRFGGKMGVRFESEIAGAVNKELYVFVNPWYRYCAWVSNASNVDGFVMPYDESSLSEFEIKIGASIYGARVFGGYRMLSGSKTVDWLIDDSLRANNARIYDEERHAYNELALRGPILGGGYSFEAVGGGLDSYRYINIFVYTMLVSKDVLIKNYYFFEVNYIPESRGMCYFLSFGRTSPKKIFELSLGAGYQF